MFSAFAAPKAFAQMGAAAPPPGTGTGVYEQAALYMDFQNNAARVNGVWGPAVPALTTTRASVAQMDTSTGFWGEFAANAPRWSDKGLLVEEARTNSLRNNTMTGAAAGTPGTLPTNWALSIAGITSQVVGVGNDHGVDYIDIRFSGTTSQTFINIYMETTTGIVAATSQVWTASAFVAVVGGSVSALTAMFLAAHQNTSGGGFLAQTVFGAADFRTQVTSSLTRFAGTLTADQATVGALRPFLAMSLPNGSVIDFTIRIGWPQTELGSFATSPIKTTAAAATRAADVIIANNFGTWYNAVTGTLWAEFEDPNATVAATFPGAASFNDNGTQNRICLFRNAVSGFSCDVRVTNVTQAGFTFGTTSPRKTAIAYALNDFAGSSNGATVQTDGVGTLPTVTCLSVGAIANIAGGLQLNGYLRRIAYWNTRLTNAQLQAITA